MPFAPLGAGVIDGGILERFQAVVREWPNRIAIEDDIGDHMVCWRYEHLARRALGLARTIERHRLPRDEPVAIHVDQGREFIWAVLGVLQAGRFWVPLDPSIAIERNRHILEDSGAKWIITNRHREAETRELAPAARRLVLDDIRNGSVTSWRLPEVGPDDLAYLLYTSGSTGRPKGVMHTHRSVMHNTWRHVNAFEIRPEDRQTLFYPCTVYGGVRDIFNTLLSGACLCRYPLQREGIAPMADWMRERRVTLYCSVATVFRQFAGTLPASGPGEIPFPDLRQLKLGGEAVYRSDVEVFRRAFGRHSRLSCGLGATEIGAATQMFIDHETALPQDRVGCGEASEDVDIAILDPESGEPLKPGEAGEIAVESRGIAAGYWRNPEATAHSFPVNPDTGTRRYLTGDLGSLDGEGRLQHQGRKDRQVKIHGNRVEIPEVEVALLGCPGVAEAVVEARELHGALRLVAFVVPGSGGGGDLDEAKLREQVGSRLPPYMVPTHVRIQSALPMLPNGKVARDQLQWSGEGASPRKREPDHAPDDTDRADAQDPEQVLRAIWQQVFGRKEILGTDHFFDLGGDSLMLMNMMDELDHRLDRHVPPAVISRAPSFDELLEAVRSVLSDEQDPRLQLRRRGLDRMQLARVPIQPDGDRPPLFFVAPAGGTIVPYLSLAQQLGDNQPFHALSVATGEDWDVLRDDIDIAAAAEQLADLVQEVHPAGRIILGGWSFGGFMAWQLAQVLRRRGLQVERVWVVDSESRLVGRKMSVCFACYAMWMFGRLVAHTWKLRLRAWWQRRRRRGDARGALRPEDWLYGWRFHGLHQFMRAIRRYDMPDSDVPVSLVRPGMPWAERTELQRHARGWDRHAHVLELVPTSGNHFTAFRRPHLDAMAAAMRD